jgi:Uma2 family endonuclease
MSLPFWQCEGQLLDKLYYYPDAFVTYDLRDHNDRSIKRHPKLIASVLSANTEAFDKGEKFEDYQQIESLEECQICPPQRS